MRARAHSLPLPGGSLPSWGTISKPASWSTRVLISGNFPSACEVADALTLRGHKRRLLLSASAPARGPRCPLALCHHGKLRGWLRSSKAAMCSLRL